MGYFQTLIAVADDCPVTRSEVPPLRAGTKTVARLEYELLSQHPGTLTQEDVLFQTWLLRQKGTEPSESDDPSSEELSEPEVARLRDQFFSKSRACLRSSPLPKRYGWGLLFDAEGRITLCPMESEQYKAIVEGKVPGVRVVKAMRSRRAR